MQFEKDYYFDSIDFYLKTKKMSTYEIQHLKHPLIEQIPKHLYKYRKKGEEGRIDFYVGKRNIYFASLNSFHDFCEGVTPATKKRFVDYNAEEFFKYYKDTILGILKENFPLLQNKIAGDIYELFLEEHFDNELVYERFKEKINDSEKKKFETLLSSLGYIFKKFDTELNSNTQFAQGMNTLLHINEEMGAYCMCDTYSNDNLWEFYADNFEGYCIEYDLTNPCKSKGSLRLITNLYPVKYVKKKDDDWFRALFKMTIKAISKEGRANEFQGSLFFQHWMTEVLCSKKDVRSWEREWRVLGKADAKYLGPLISCIIVGHKINKDDFLAIQKYAKKNYYKLKITDIDYENQEVIVRDITFEDIDKILARIK